MNRKNLTAAVLAGLAGAAGIVGSAQAVNINPDGLGQVLIYPYYTVNGGNTTALSVVNTTEEAKAVKVRFLEGQNSQEVLDFNLYMSKYDVWTAAIFDNEGTPTLVVNDTTCTVPYLYMNDANDDGERDGMQAFLPYELDDGGSTHISRTAEGHFEMIEMGTLVDDEMNSATAATHVPQDEGPQMPPDSWIEPISDALGLDKRPCGQLNDAWTEPDNLTDGDEGYWLNTLYGPLTDLENPSGGLFGGAAIVNVDAGTMYSYDATAVNGFAEGLTDGEIPGTALHQQPGYIIPGLNSGDQLTGTVFLDDGSTLTATMTRGVDAVSYVFMHDQIMNEYTTEAAVNAATEWVITFPTKQFYVFADQTGDMDPPLAPFTSEWLGEGACEYVQLDKIWDREEESPGTDPGTPIPPIVSPAPDEPPVEGKFPFELCYETSVIAFDGTMDDDGDGGDGGDDPQIEHHLLPADEGGVTPILGSTNFHIIENGALGFEYGWARLQMADYPPTNEDGEIIAGDDLTRSLGGLDGLPVTGFAVMRFENGFLGEGSNTLANYGGIFKHKATRRETMASAAPGTAAQ
mgnify:CR=1 FL=1